MTDRNEAPIKTIPETCKSNEQIVIEEVDETPESGSHHPAEIIVTNEAKLALVELTNPSESDAQIKVSDEQNDLDDLLKSLEIGTDLKALSDLNQLIKLEHSSIENSTHFTNTVANDSSSDLMFLGELELNEVPANKLDDENGTENQKPDLLVNLTTCSHERAPSDPMPLSTYVTENASGDVLSLLNEDSTECFYDTNEAICTPNESESNQDRQAREVLSSVSLSYQSTGDPEPSEMVITKQTSEPELEPRTIIDVEHAVLSDDLYPG